MTLIKEAKKTNTVDQLSENANKNKENMNIMSFLVHKIVQYMYNSCAYDKTVSKLLQNSNVLSLPILHVGMI